MVRLQDPAAADAIARAAQSLEAFTAVRVNFDGIFLDPSALPFPGEVVIDGVALPFVDQTTAPAGVTPGTFNPALFTVGPAPSPVLPPEGYLIPAVNGPVGGLTAAQVAGMISNAVATANQTRALIRLPPGVKAKTRAILNVKAGERVKVRWTLTNRHDKATFKNIVIHFFVVKQERIGQQDIPKLNKGVLVESALTMDFEPKDRTKGELTFTIDMPGAYLIRVETIGAAADAEGHEHFAALDLVLE